MYFFRSPIKSDLSPNYKFVIVHYQIQNPLIIVSLSHIILLNRYNKFDLDILEFAFTQLSSDKHLEMIGIESFLFASNVYWIDFGISMDNELLVFTSRNRFVSVVFESGISNIVEQLDDQRIWCRNWCLSRMVEIVFRIEIEFMLCLNWPDVAVLVIKSCLTVGSWSQMIFV